MNAPTAITGPDLFGQATITEHDLFAWLLRVPKLDPASPHAGRYVRGYNVLEKIARAKADGSFEQILAEAEVDPRFRDLVSAGLPAAAVAELFAPKRPIEVARTPTKRRPNRRIRPREVVEAERVRLAAEREERRRGDQSLLRRLPHAVPSLSNLLAEIGSPSAFYLAKAMHVPTEEAERWIAEDHAPQSVLLALFWLTRWGVAQIDADAHNAAVLHASLAESSQQQAAQLRGELARVSRIADFGSANDPLPTVQAHRRLETPSPLPTAEPVTGALRRTAQGGEAQGGRGAARPAAEERLERGPEASPDLAEPERRRACAG